MSDLKVVLVEPSRFQATIVHRYLLELRIENVVTARSGRDALELAKREGTSVVLSSMHLPDMTGMELAQALHDDPGSLGVGFVLISSDCDSAWPAAPWMRRSQCVYRNRSTSGVWLNR